MDRWPALAGLLSVPVVEVESVVRKARWVFPEFDDSDRGRLAHGADCSTLFAGLLLRRGVREVDAARDFLEPKLLQLSDPDELPDMGRAVDRIERALRDGETIAVFGDYDVDGVTSTCLLVDFFHLIDHSVRYRLPHRVSEGYGLREATVRELAADGVELLITVDNGSSSRREIDLANELGMEVVVVDHHQPSEDLPRPVAHVNPLLDTTGRVFPDFAGVGVVYKLVWALSKRLSRATKLSPQFRTFLLDSLGLVAMGTIADVVNLHGENRVLAKFGLQALSASRRPGIRALVTACLSPGSGARPRGQGGAATDAVRARVESNHVGFRLGPRINAVGRLGSAETALELLTTDCETRAQELLGELETENIRRREIERAMFEEARAMVLESYDLESERAIVVGDPGWHPGVVGIVASRLVEEFFRPAVVFAIDGDRARGSARSIPQVHLTDAFGKCRDLLRGYGGHAMAAGAELDPSRLEEFRAALSDAVDVPVSEMVPEIESDGPVQLPELTGQFLDDLRRLEPHGRGNPEPLLVARDLEVVGEPRRMGKDGRHLSFFVRAQGRAFRAVAFGQADRYDEITRLGRVSLLFQPTWNTWRGKKEIELNVRDIRLGD